MYVNAGVYTAREMWTRACVTVSVCPEKTKNGRKTIGKHVPDRFAPSTDLKTRHDDGGAAANGRYEHTTGK